GGVDAVAQEGQADGLRADAAAAVEDRQRPVAQQPPQEAVEGPALPPDAFLPVLEQQVVVAAQPVVEPHRRVVHRPRPPRQAAPGRAYRGARGSATAAWRE